MQYPSAAVEWREIRGRRTDCMRWLSERLRDVVGQLAVRASVLIHGTS